jgi:Zn-dependent protease
MSWSFRLGKFFGTDVYIHFTFVLLLGFIGLSHWMQTREALEAVIGVAFFAALFGCVLLHEFGHVLTARKYGVQTRDITLLPIGGVARLERMPEKPIQEFWVALAGPAVNVVIAGLLAVYLIATSSMEPLGNLSLVGGSFLNRLLVVNVMIVVFNLLPAFPMDGGRVLRALLAMRMDYSRATHIAARLGQFMAIVFAFVGLFWNPFLVFIALFVWIGAAQESGMVQMKSALSGLPMKRLMITDYRSLAPTDPLSSAVDHILAGFQQDFPVIDADGTLVGMLTRADLITALAEHGQERMVSEVMQREFQTADPHDMAENVMERLHECQCRSLPVLQDNRLIGILTAENLGEFLMIQTALHRKPAPEVAV